MLLFAVHGIEQEAKRRAEEKESIYTFSTDDTDIRIREEQAAIQCMIQEASNKSVFIFLLTILTFTLTRIALNYGFNGSIEHISFDATFVRRKRQLHYSV